MWVLDTEDNSKGKVYWINFFQGTEHVYFSKRERAIEWILDQSGDFWAVNLEYDLINLFGPLLDKLCVLTYGGFGLLKATLFGRPVKFFNTLRHWALSVEDMGERLGYKKLPFDPTSLRYCQRDCEVTWFFIQEMMKRYAELGIQQVKATLPSTALKLFTESYCKVRYVRDDRQKVWEFLAQARYGGRCEVYFNKPIQDTVWEFDINSSYPHVMRTEAFPNLDSIDPFPKSPRFDREGVATCTVQAPQLEFPVLPYKCPESKKLLFPLGQFTGTWTYPEIRVALSVGYALKKVHACVEYEPMPSPFKGYVDFLYSRRQEVKEKDPLMAYTLKIAMNSTFGKFGEEGELQIVSKNGRHSLSNVPKHSNMIWAAYILAYGRLNLYRFMQEGAERGKLLYVDTDSVFVRAPKRPFTPSRELGALDFKGKHSYAHFKLPKLYRVEDTYKAKGIPNDLHNKAFPQKLKKDFFYDGIAEFMRPYRFLEARKVKEIPNLWRTVTKQLQSEYTKRKVYRDGNTWPLIIGG